MNENIKELSLFERISNQYNSMSKGQKKLAEFIMSNYEKAVFMTAAKLGETVSVSESTAVRFASLLGYEGFPEFHKALEVMVQEKLETITKIDIRQGSLKQEEIIETVMLSDIERIKRTLQELPQNVIRETIQSISQAKRIYIMGVRSCEPLARYLGFYLNLMLQNVTVITSAGTNEVFEQMLNIGENDVFIGISFPRYSIRTIKAMQFANDRRAKVISLTDHLLSPLNLYSSCNLYAKSEMATLIDSLTAPMSVINALIVSLYMKDPEKITRNLEILEKIWDDYQMDSNDEMNAYVDEMSMLHYEDDETSDSTKG